MSSEHHTHFDLVVIGGGAAGSQVADGAVAAGLKVALIEEDQLGGTCLNYGCDPTNAFIRTGEVLRLARSSGDIGIDIPRVNLDWLALRKRIEDMIDMIRDGDGVENTRAKGIHLYQARAELVSPHEVRVDGETLSAELIVIAAGSATEIPDIDGLADVGYLTHRDVFTIDELPRSLIIVGAGGNAIEFAQAYLNFGLEVTVVTTEPRILINEDEDVVLELTRVLERAGLVIHTGCTPVSARRSREGAKRLTVNGEDGSELVLQAEELLIATERLPRVTGLGLEAAGVGYSASGIHVDAAMRTSVPHIFAIGDVTGLYPYTHIAHYHAETALHNILHPDSPRHTDYRVVPWKVFTQPELARVGLTEATARAAGYDVVTSIMPYGDMPRPITLDERDGLAKLVVDRLTHEVLGGHIVGDSASEVIAEVALVMRHRLPVSAISDTMHAHPTMGEAVYWAAENLMENELVSTTPAP